MDRKQLLQRFIQCVVVFWILSFLQRLTATNEPLREPTLSDCKCKQSFNINEAEFSRCASFTEFISQSKHAKAPPGIWCETEPISSWTQVSRCGRKLKLKLSDYSERTVYVDQCKEISFLSGWFWYFVGLVLVLMRYAVVFTLISITTHYFWGPQIESLIPEQVTRCVERCSPTFAILDQKCDDIWDRAIFPCLKRVVPQPTLDKLMAGLDRLLNRQSNLPRPDIDERAAPAQEPMPHPDRRRSQDRQRQGSRQSQRSGRSQDRQRQGSRQSQRSDRSQDRQRQGSRQSQRSDGADNARRDDDEETPMGTDLRDAPAPENLPPIPPSQDPETSSNNGGAASDGRPPRIQDPDSPRPATPPDVPLSPTERTLSPSPLDDALPAERTHPEAASPEREQGSPVPSASPGTMLVQSLQVMRDNNIELRMELQKTDRILSARDSARSTWERIDQENMLPTSNRCSLPDTDASSAAWSHFQEEKRRICAENEQEKQSLLQQAQREKECLIRQKEAEKQQLRRALEKQIEAEKQQVRRDLEKQIEQQAEELRKIAEDERTELLKQLATQEEVMVELCQQLDVCTQDRPQEISQGSANDWEVIKDGAHAKDEITEVAAAIERLSDEKNKAEREAQELRLKLQSVDDIIAKQHDGDSIVISRSQFEKLAEDNGHNAEAIQTWDQLKAISAQKVIRVVEPDPGDPAMDSAMSPAKSQRSIVSKTGSISYTCIPSVISMSANPAYKPN